MDRSDLAERMKGYEKRNRYYLQRRIPVILRLDMRAGHSLTKGFERPFDEVFIKTIQETAKYLCENIQNCKLSYQQSDEITLLLVDYEKINTGCFFEYRVDKLCSIAASMATMKFNQVFKELSYIESENLEIICRKNPYLDRDCLTKISNVHTKSAEKGAMFDCRCFNIPKEEITNCIYWRQLDATRNSIQMVGQANFSHKELQNKSCNDIQDMLMTQKGINWNDLPIYQKRGSCCVRNKIIISTDGVMETVQLRDTYKAENEWVIDKDIPIFKGEGRRYIDDLVFVGE